MVTHLPEEKILFSCDFLGSHIATSRLYAGRSTGSRRPGYYAEILMPFRSSVQGNLKKSDRCVRPDRASHGPIL
jgi:flavorubredoxin